MDEMDTMDTMDEMDEVGGLQYAHFPDAPPILEVEG